MRRVVRCGLILLLAAGCRAADSPIGVEDSGILGPAGATGVAVVVALRPDLAPGRHETNRVRAGEIARELGAVPTQTYGTAIFGFAGTVPAGRLDGLRRDPRVETVELDQEWTLAAQTLPTGINRIEADRNPNADIDGDNSVVNLDVAIIDTGIDGSHADLNVAGGYNATSTDPAAWGDGNGHGTHVAGTVGARDNGIGVVGVAPGVRVWAIKVCPTNTCPSSAMVAGIDWAAARKRDFKNGAAGGINFASANMSISTANDATACKSTSDVIHKAICGLVNEGVVFALAAGNNGTVKQAYPEVIAVSALVDYDGRPGALASPTCANYGADDRLASFSNYGSTIDIAAPGGCILSTYKGGAYATLSGTSMATPHVAGAIALYLHANGLSPATNSAGVQSITSAILAAGQPVGSACGYTNQRGYTEPLLFVNGAAFGGDGTCDGLAPPPPDNPPSVSVSSPSAGATVSGTVTVTASASDDNGVTRVEFFVDGASIGVDNNSAGGWSVSWNTTTATNGSHSLTARATDTANQSTTSAGVSVTVDNGSGGGGDTSMHVGGLAGASSSKGNSGKWSATVTVTVHDGSHGPVANATVSGTWSGAKSGSFSGVTGSNGTVTIQTGNMSSGTSVTLTVTNVTHATRTYDSSANHDPTGANPAITVNR